MYEAYNRDKSGSFSITEQGDLGLGLTPIEESEKEDEKKR